MAARSDSLIRLAYVQHAAEDLLQSTLPKDGRPLAQDPRQPGK
ncbi:hypothetical protein [Nonomuraea sp. SYSU D8015]|nr:hypothetical protein [Nonomuraea sp. SYSU D8015]